MPEEIFQQTAPSDDDEFVIRFGSVEFETILKVFDVVVHLGQLDKGVIIEPCRPWLIVVQLDEEGVVNDP